MPEDSLDTVWKRIDCHEKRINDHETEVKLSSAAIDQIQKDNQAAQTRATMAHGELVKSITTLGNELKPALNLVVDDYKHRQGVNEQKKKTSSEFKWVVGIAITTALGVLAVAAGVV
jgi:hypothetical protein